MHIASETDMNEPTALKLLKNKHKCAKETPKPRWPPNMVDETRSNGLVNSILVARNSAERTDDGHRPTQNTRLESDKTVGDRLLPRAAEFS
jgi:hypothetical protein